MPSVEDVIFAGVVDGLPSLAVSSIRSTPRLLAHSARPTSAVCRARRSVLTHCRCAVLIRCPAAPCCPSVPLLRADLLSRCSACSPQGKCVAITGCTTGTGYWCAVAAARKGAACVLLLNRASDRAEAAEKAIKAEGGARVETVACDLQSYASVRAAAAKLNAIAAEFGGLDALVNNAGVMGVPDERTGDGFDVQMQTNHLSHFLLTKLAMPSLDAAAAARGEARIVQHSSGARGGGRSDDGVGHLRPEFFAACEAGSLGGDGEPANFMAPCFNRYHQTKLSNSVFCVALHNKLQAAGSKVKSLVGEPGVATTELAGNLVMGHIVSGNDTSWTAGMAKMYPTQQSAADGACPIMMCAFAAEAGSGDFYAPKDSIGEGPMGGVTMGMPVKVLAGGAMADSCPAWTVEKYASEELTLCKADAEILWSASEAAIGESFSIGGGGVTTTVTTTVTEGGVTTTTTTTTTTTA